LAEQRGGPSRLGLFIDGAFTTVDGPGGTQVRSGTELTGFMRFACAVGDRLGGLRLIARRSEDVGETPNELPASVALSPLPNYQNLRAVGRVLAALPRTIGSMWRGLGQVDVVWVSGVHPLGLVLVGLAALRRRRIVLLIRQDSPRYFRSRLPSPRWRPLLAPLWLLDLAFRLLALRLSTTVVGADLARRYRAPRRNVLEMNVTLMERSQLVEHPSAADWSGQIGLLTVGRIAPEKDPLLLIRALELLHAVPGADYRVTWAGEGPLVPAVREAAATAGLGDRVELPGFIPFGPDLLDRYRGAHAFVHVAATEGVPQVLFEAMAAGLPIVATDVGGVREAMHDGELGLLVPPGDPQALVDAIERLRTDAALRERLAANALEAAADVTLDSEAPRVAAFIATGDAT
jgi:glycosyltransferase involved in cell wall biosynthesis